MRPPPSSDPLPPYAAPAAHREARRPLSRRVVGSSATVRYLIAGGVTVVAVLARLSLDPVWGTRFPFITLFPAVMLSAWLGGRGPGLVTTALTAVAACYLWIEPARSWGIANPSDWIGVAVFVLVGVAISALNEAWRSGAQQLQSALQEHNRAEDRFRRAVEAAPAAMLMVDERGTIVLTNALTEQLLGYPRDELLGESIERVVPARFHPGHSAHRASFLADARQRPMGAGRDLYAVRRDGSEIPVEIGLSPICSSDGTLVLAAVTDISARKQMERDRAELLTREQEARAELERASRLKDEFLAVLSHELRTPVNALLGYAQLLRSGVLPADRIDTALEAVERNARLQAALIDSLLDLSRIMAGKLELELQVVELSQVVATAIDVVRLDAEAKEVTLEPAGSPAPVSVMGDGGRLQQVCWNLLSNAIKFTPRGGQVRIGWTERDGHARLEVSDDGQGIGAELLPHIFDRFTQGARRGGGSRRGLGLGLAVVREIVQAHGGTVLAESAGEGRGSTFVVTLPLAHTERTSAVPARDAVLGATRPGAAAAM